jgi:sulfocyanin
MRAPVPRPAAPLARLLLALSLAACGTQEGDAAGAARDAAAPAPAPAAAPAPSAGWTGPYSLRGTLESGGSVTGRLALEPLVAGADGFDATRERVRQNYPSYEGPFYRARMTLDGGGDPARGHLHLRARAGHPGAARVPPHRAAARAGGRHARDAAVGARAAHRQPRRGGERRVRPPLVDRRPRRLTASVTQPPPNAAMPTSRPAPRGARALAALTAAALGACAGGGGEQPADSAAAAQSSVAAAAPAAPPPAAASKPAMPAVDPENVNASIEYDAAAKTVRFPNVSGLTASAGGWNFNGFANGNATLVVPLGTTVEMEYYNADAHPHSVGIVAGRPDAIPSAPGDPVFANAISAKYQSGMPSGARDVVKFTADKPGTFLMVCGVPGHAPSGMWIKVEVSRTAKSPTFRKS